METTNRPSRPDRLEIFWNDWGDRDDPDDHMETGIYKKAGTRGVLVRTHPISAIASS